MNFPRYLVVVSTVMKSILMLAASLLAWPFLSSCSDYGTYGYSAGYSSGGYASPGYGYSSGYGYNYAPLQVGFISTTYDRWSYDPYRRCYYDRSLRRYYNYGSRTYYSSPPRRYSTPYYPTGYRKGRPIAAPSYLPRHSGNHGPQRGSGSYNRGPVNSGNYNRGSYNRGSSNYNTSPRGSVRTPSPVIIRNSSNNYERARSSSREEAVRRSQPSQFQRSQSSSPRIETIRTPVRQAPTPRAYTPRPETQRSAPQRSAPQRSSSRYESSSSAPVRASNRPTSRGNGQPARERVR